MGIVAGMVAALVLGLELARFLPTLAQRSAVTTAPGDPVTRQQVEAELQRFQITMDDWEDKMRLLYDRTRKRMLVPSRKAQDDSEGEGEASSIPLNPKDRAREKARGLLRLSAPGQALRESTESRILD